jgi:enoyl-CoA hydratase/carnithine racemase
MVSLIHPLKGVDMPTIRVTKHAAWAHIRIERAAKRNALNQAARLELLAALRELHDSAAALVLTGSEEWFCSGADIKERAQWIAEEKPDTTAAEGIELALAIHDFPGIVIAAVNGLVLGYGLNLVNSCDLALAADRARFGLPELRSGSFASMSIATGHLSGLNRKQLGWLIFGTEPIDAASAASWGIVNEVVPADQLEARAGELAARIASFDPVVVAETKAGLRQIQDADTHWRRAIDEGQRIGARIKGHTKAHT